MQGFGSLIRLKPEYEERYIILHKHIFPNVLSQINKVNIRNYSIFLRDGMLFSYYEYIGDNYQRDMENIADETTREWWKLTDPMQEPLEDRREGEWWAFMDPVIQFDNNQMQDKTAVFHAAFAIKIDQNIDFSSINIPKDAADQAGISKIRAYQRNTDIYTYIESKYAVTAENDISKRIISSANIENKVHLVFKPMKQVFHTD